jgi:hypothetical protein
MFSFPETLGVVCFGVGHANHGTIAVYLYRGKPF